MDKLTKIADVLMDYAKGGPPGSIPKVHFELTFESTDIPDAVCWNLKVRLSAFEKLDESGNAVPCYEKEWASDGHSPEQCQNLIMKQLKDFFAEALANKRAECDAVQNALDMIKVEANLEDLWVTKEPQEKSQPASESATKTE